MLLSPCVFLIGLHLNSGTRKISVLSTMDNVMKLGIIWKLHYSKLLIVHQLILSRTTEPLNWIKSIACSSTALQLWPVPDVWEEGVINSTGHNIGRPSPKISFFLALYHYLQPSFYSWLITIVIYTPLVYSGWRCNTKHTRNSCLSGKVPWVNSRTTEGWHQRVLLPASAQLFCKPVPRAQLI